MQHEEALRKAQRAVEAIAARPWVTYTHDLTCSASEDAPAPEHAKWEPSQMVPGREFMIWTEEDITFVKMRDIEP